MVKKVYNRLELVKLAKQIVNFATEHGIDLRIFGSIAVDIHCEYSDDKIASNPRIGDIDLIAKTEQLDKVIALFTQIGFKQTNAIFVSYGWHYEFTGEKINFYNEISAEVYFGTLSFSHKIPPPYFDRLNKFTIPLSTLFLSKLAIQELKPKDKLGLFNLLYHHNLATNGQKESIQLSYLGKALSKGWQSWELSKTCLSNLLELKQSLNMIDVNEIDYIPNISTKIDELIKFISKTKKNCGWNTRNIVGTKIKYYKPTS